MDDKQTLYPWLESTWKSLIAYHQQGRLPGALMITGGAGFGLLELAKQFSHTISCSNSDQNHQPCQSCSACLMFEAGTYPDFIFVQPEEDESSIKIDAIRDLSEKLSLKNQYGQQRIALIYPAEAMPHAAANSLLKTLEEPNDNTSIILVSHQPAKLPATIRSRCQILHINQSTQAAQADMVAWLASRGCDATEQYLSLANGRPLLAESLWKQNALLVRDELFDSFERLIQGNLSPTDFAEIYLKKKDYPVLSWLMSWLTDTVKIASQAESKMLLNAELSARLKVLLERLQLKQIHSLLERLTIMLGLEQSTVSKQLLLESFAIRCITSTPNKGVH